MFSSCVFEHSVFPNPLLTELPNFVFWFLSNEKRYQQIYISDYRVALVKYFYQQLLLVGFNPTGDWFSPQFFRTPISYLFRTLKEKSYTVDYNMLYLNTFHLSLMEYVQNVSTEIWECLFFYLIHKLYP